MKQVLNKPASQEASPKTDPLQLYDRFSALAYGVILRIIPDPQPAQAVLTTLFTSPPLTMTAGHDEPTPADIIRLARGLALASLAEPGAAVPPLNPGDSLEKQVFELSFCQGYTSDRIADKLQITPASVLRSISAYFKYLRSS